MQEYKDFAAYDLLDTGEKRELDITMDDIQTYLASDKVFLFVRKDIRRLFIWKGSVSPVRKRFISSRVAQQLQAESQRNLKIISVDQGDEPLEFLNAFGLESMEVTEKLGDMYYVRNVDREKQEMEEMARKRREEEKNKGYWSPVLGTIKDGEVVSEGEEGSKKVAPEPSKSTPAPPVKQAAPKKKTPAPPVKQTGSASPASSTGPASTANDNEITGILEEVRQNDLPAGKTQLNIIIGNYLYGPIVQKITVFGKTVENIKWELIEELPDEMIDLGEKHLRIYTASGSGGISAVEILEESSGDESAGKKDLEKEEKSADTPPADKPAKKAATKPAKKRTKRALKKIPSA